MNSNKKLLPLRQLRIPLLGLLLMLGGVFAYRAKPVLSTQMEYLRTLAVPGSVNQTYTWLQRNPSLNIGSISKEARLRGALNSHTNVKQAYLHQEFGLQYNAKIARLRKRLASTKKAIAPWAQQHSVIAQSHPFSKSSLNSNYQEPTYTWLQRDSSKPITKTQLATTQGTIAPKGNFPQKNGVYLYGQSSQPGQMGQGYIVFQKQQTNVVGALYIPGSEFNCFYGTINPSGQLAMTVKGFAGDSSLTQVAANNTIPRLDEDQPTTYSHTVALQDYYQLNSVSAKDHQILNMCKANLHS